ncbi:MAG: hypothetical protein L0177_07845, partial [Chloroflexi bacterium]|nr:hypothetical protein [Chloroflexota bacterium]
SRALPRVLEFVNAQLGGAQALQISNYVGFFGAMALFDRLRDGGAVKYGKPSGPNPTIYLPDEEIEEAAALSFEPAPMSRALGYLPHEDSEETMAEELSPQDYSPPYVALTADNQEQFEAEAIPQNINDERREGYS